MNQDKIDRFDGIEHEFLSNFYPAPILWMSDTYPTTEHAFQAAKVMGEGEDWNEEARVQIRDCPTPGKAKRMGRKCHLRRNWDSIKNKIMFDLVFIKFTTYSNLAQKLLETGDKELIEGNDWNDVWFGVCNGVGENHLGKILMEVRDSIRRNTISVSK